jgi:polyferredoxin
VARSRLPLLRRISQIFFLLLFLGLLVFTSLRPAPGGTGDIHLRLPVRLFFEWDPLVAVANALASHALYRGLLWSLLILVPTLFLGRFFCGWICPMGTLQHFVGNLPSEAKRGKQRIQSNRYKRWQTGKYVVLIAGLVAAFFGSAAIGWLDPFSLLVRSFGLSLLPAFNFAVRAVLAPLEHSHIAVIKAFRAGLGVGDSVSGHSVGEHARHASLVPVHLPAGRTAGHRFPLVGPGAAQGPRKVQ